MICPARGMQIFSAGRPYSTSSNGFAGLVLHSRSRWTKEQLCLTAQYQWRMGDHFYLPPLSWMPRDDGDSDVKNRRRLWFPVSVMNPTAVSWGRRGGYKQQAHCFSSRCPEDKHGPDTKSPSPDVKRDVAGSPPVEGGTDPEFASYLSGEMRPSSPLDDFELAKRASIAVMNQRRSTAAKRSRTFALDNNKELYREIVSNQMMQKEKSRLKTASNVYRALIGNVVICTGAFLSSAFILCSGALPISRV